MIKHYHQIKGHQGSETVLNKLRKIFWIPKARASINKIVFDCLYCKKSKCKPIEPRMAPVPKERVLFNAKPFTATGMDYLEPFQEKIGRRLEKSNVVLFT